jgi:hypothetical protein
MASDACQGKTGATVQSSSSKSGGPGVEFHKLTRHLVHGKVTTEVNDSANNLEAPTTWNSKTKG